MEIQFIPSKSNGIPTSFGKRLATLKVTIKMPKLIENEPWGCLVRVWTSRWVLSCGFAQRCVSPLAWFQATLDLSHLVLIENCWRNQTSVKDLLLWSQHPEQVQLEGPDFVLHQNFPPFPICFYLNVHGSWGHGPHPMFLWSRHWLTPSKAPSWAIQKQKIPSYGRLFTVPGKWKESLFKKLNRNEMQPETDEHTLRLLEMRSMQDTVFRPQK